MVDKEWMLNPKAIRYAKECMHIVKDELGVKLMLSNPSFMSLLHEYVEMIESPKLGTAYANLIAMAGPGSILAEITRKEDKENPTYHAGVSDDRAVAGSDTSPTHDPNETVTIKGRVYPKWHEGKKLHGLYRGQPSYK